MAGCFSRNRAICNALSLWCFTRRASVLMPRCSRKAAWGSRLPPRWFSLWVTFSIRLDFPITAPATMSEWPLRYLVALWRDRSKPNSDGRKSVDLGGRRIIRSEEHTSELQSRPHLVCRLLLEKNKTKHSDYQD